jgi:hypothetical protein
MKTRGVRENVARAEGRFQMIRERGEAAIGRGSMDVGGAAGRAVESGSGLPQSKAEAGVSGR